MFRDVDLAGDAGTRNLHRVIAPFGLEFQVAGHFVSNLVDALARFDPTQGMLSGNSHACVMAPVLIDVARKTLSYSVRRTPLLQERHHQECNNIDDLDQRVDCRTGRIFVRIAYSVTGDSGFVGV